MPPPSPHASAGPVATGLATNPPELYHTSMGYVLSKVIGALLAPGMVLAIVFAAGVAMLWSRRRQRQGRALLTILVLVVGAMLVSPLQPWLTETLENRFPGNPPLPAHVDGIIVLGGAIEPLVSEARQRIALNDAAERLTATVMLAKTHPEALVLYTGGSADPLRQDAAEAPLAEALLRALGVPADRLLVEGKSRNTFENALLSQDLVKPQAGQVWVLVTSARHMPRSVGIFHRLNWPVIPYPVDYQSGGDFAWTNVDLPLRRGRLLAQALHEWVGLAYYALNGWTDRLFPGPDDREQVEKTISRTK
ncbi:YdcF family protein [Telmatospirillum siberiense]|nr:ElyC/SanA/YdcF family protein [Telmatospirillum siberiense]